MVFWGGQKNSTFFDRFIVLFVFQKCLGHPSHNQDGNRDSRARNIIVSLENDKSRFRT